MIEDEKYFTGRDILNQCYSYNQLYYFYRELGLKGIDRYINELQNESKSKSREIERLNNIIKEVKDILKKHICNPSGLKDGWHIDCWNNEDISKLNEDLRILDRENKHDD